MASTIKRKINEGITQVKNAASFIITDVTSHWSKPGKGNYVCTNCGFSLKLGMEDKMPPCPNCNNTTFTKD